MEAFLFFECLTLAILGSRFGVRRHGQKKIYNFFLTVTGKAAKAKQQSSRIKILI